MTFDTIARYRKAVVAAIPFALSIIAEFAGTESPLYVKAVLLATALGVARVTNAT